ncbi:MAG TPA: hypothetical protein ENJ19_07980 [Gammaproteobacteria bacterium]|nr:hypothetical protein [Gammaproteobacteria bacterium]
MTAALTQIELKRQSNAYRGTGGVSEENRSFGFRPAFFDRNAGRLFLSCFLDGTPAPMHIFDGLPDALIAERDAEGFPIKLYASVIAGFERDGHFFTREQTAQLIEWELDKQAAIAL